jgi:hypothetical protein
MSHTRRYHGLYRYNAYRIVHVGRFSEEQPVPSTCYLELWEGDTETLVITTEIAANPGMSITNAYEWLATQIAREHWLDPQRTRWIEHYGPMSYEYGRTPDTYDLVTLIWDGRAASNPDWRRLTSAEVAALPSQMGGRSI